MAFGLSLIAMRGLSCHKACEILVPSPGIQPASPALGGCTLNYWTTREVPTLHFR